MNENNMWWMAILGLVVVGILAALLFVGTGTPIVGSPAPVYPARPVVETGEEPNAEVSSQTETNGELSDWDVIVRYYSSIPHSLDAAYAMRVEDPSVSFETFQEWYKDAWFARPRNEVPVSDHVYQFLVELAEENPYRIALYDVVMKVEDGRVETVSSTRLGMDGGVELGGAQYGSNGPLSTVLWDKGAERLTFSPGGALVGFEIDSIDRNLRDNAFISFGLPQEFSPSGRFLSYPVTWFEGVEIKVYDSKQSRIAHTIQSPSAYGMDNAETWFAECQGSGMSSGYLRVYNLPEFALRYEHPALSENLAFGTCALDTDNGSVYFDLENWEEQTKQSYRYDVKANKVIAL